MIRSHLKKVFWPKLGVGRSYQILEIPVYSSGLIFAAALILNQNPFFEIASNQKGNIAAGSKNGCFLRPMLGDLVK